MPHVSYFWDEMEGNVVEEYDGDTGNTIATHTTEPTLYGSVLSQDRSGEKRYFQFDGLGNTTELTDGAGNVTDERLYVDNRPTTFVDPSGWLKVAITARDFDRACGYYSVLWAVTPRAFERSAITAPPSPRSSGPRFVIGAWDAEQAIFRATRIGR